MAEPRQRTEEGLTRENFRIRHERNAARDALLAMKPILHEYQVESVEHRLAGRLAMEDFEYFIGLEKVLDADGRIDGWGLEQLVGALLQRRPRLALSGSEDVSTPAVS